MNKTLQSFVDYCEKNKSLRFWQALQSWSQFSFIYGSSKDVAIEELQIKDLTDTYYIEDEK
jgi:hypothetical protein